MRKIIFPVLVAPPSPPEAGSNGQPRAPRVGDILANTLQPTPQEGGVTLEVMETWVPLARKLRKAETSIMLEDAEYDLLASRLKVTKWAMSTEDIVAIGKAVREAEIIEVEESVGEDPADFAEEAAEAEAVEEGAIGIPDGVEPA